MEDGLKKENLSLRQHYLDQVPLTLPQDWVYSQPLSFQLKNC